MSAWLPVSRAQWLGVLAGIVLLAGLLIAHDPPQQKLLSYLTAFVFFTGLSTGALALIMIHGLTGGSWGDHLQAPLLAAARMLPWQALLILPLLFNIHDLYPWAGSEHASAPSAQDWYLNPPFFIVRSIAYFAVWLILLAFISRAVRDPRRSAILPRIAAPGLILYALSTLFASTDWLMSLMPAWHSAGFGMMVATGWLLAACALGIFQVARASDRSDGPLTPEALRDLGSLLLMFVLAWSYLAFMQYLTIWVADLPPETAWYLPRTLTSWRALAWFLILCNFAVPFALLLSRRAKANVRWLRALAAMLLVAGVADAFWLVVPSFRAQGFAVRGSDLLALAGMGALWWSVYPLYLQLARSLDATSRLSPNELRRVHG